MRVKVGDQWFDSQNVPVMVELTAEDKDRITNMASTDKRYAVFPTEMAWADQRRSWMNEPEPPSGARVPARHSYLPDSADVGIVLDDLNHALQNAYLNKASLLVINLFARHAVLRVKYRNHEGVVAWRYIVPREIRHFESEWHAGTQWIVRAFDLNKRAFREFAICDMLCIEDAGSMVDLGSAERDAISDGE